MTTYVVVPSGGGGKFGVPSLIAMGIGAVLGALHQFNGGDPASAAGAAAAIPLVAFNIAGDYVANLAPTSEVVYVVGWIIRWIFGIYFAIPAAIGGFLGAGAVWIVVDVLGGLANAQIHH